MYRSSIHIHFIGIGGVGMGGIAEILANLGYRVSGSDLKAGAAVEHLRSLGVAVHIGHSAENITDAVSYVVVSSAISPNNPEILAAASRGIPVIPRAEMLSELMRMKYGVAVAGSHGKTTTTTMVGEVLQAGALDPTVIVGGRVLTKPSGASLGSGQFLVAEADESDGSFGLLRPAIAVVTNIDREHMSHYGSFGALEEAFFRFMSSVPFYGAVVACADDAVVEALCGKLKRRVLRYGIKPDADVCAKDIRIDNRGSRCTLVVNGSEADELQLPIPGQHMICNSLAAVAVGLELGVSLEAALQGLKQFPGVARRSQVLCQGASCPTVIDDYGHHPQEIVATLTAVRSAWFADSDKGKLKVVFQPHRFTRTQELFGDFVGAFGNADELFVGPIYAAGEPPIEGVTAEALCSAIRDTDANYVEDLNQALDSLARTATSDDVIVFLGAGDISRYAHSFAEKAGGGNKQ
ncbi:MAG: UDP-N-acetylmuramate--L-alanine ligase [Bdellovibrionales bacterium]|nr:UDP-N-acetylmuramate--L-alanine ligase [Bdellovibrionales bacterium]